MVCFLRLQIASLKNPIAIPGLSKCLKWVKNMPTMQKTPEIWVQHGLIPGLGRSPGGGHGNPLQYLPWKNPMDRGAWQAIVHSSQSDTTEVTEHTAHIAILR